MRKIEMIVIVCGVVMCLLGGCGNDSDTTIAEVKEEIVTDTAMEAVTEEIVEEKNWVDSFIETYNSSAEIPITDLVDIDIHDKSSGYYRTEFRTYAFSSAIAKHGIIGEGISMDLIQYSNGFRIYVLADSYESLQEVLVTTMKIYDSSITDDTIQAEVYDKIDHIGSGVSFYINDITGYYEIVNRKTGSCSVMLDTSSVGFIE